MYLYFEYFDLELHKLYIASYDTGHTENFMFGKTFFNVQNLHYQNALCLWLLLCSQGTNKFVFRLTLPKVIGAQQKTVAVNITIVGKQKSILLCFSMYYFRNCITL